LLCLYHVSHIFHSISNTLPESYYSLKMGRFSPGGLAVSLRSQTLGLSEFESGRAIVWRW
jgi:hypothetical protein